MLGVKIKVKLLVISLVSSRTSRATRLSHALASELLIGIKSDKTCEFKI